MLLWSKYWSETTKVVQNALYLVKSLWVRVFGPRDPYDGKVESPHLLLRVFEARTFFILNPDRNDSVVSRI